jgi:Uma2 family endonuclease
MIFACAELCGFFPAEHLMPVPASAIALDDRRGRSKRRFLRPRGVPVYWIVDPGESIETWRPGDGRLEVLDDRVAWQPAGAIRSFELLVREFFADSADNDQ